MTRIDFYLLPQDSRQALFQFACRLTEKAWQRGHRVYLHAESAADAEQLQQQLWKFRPASFIPHHLAPAAEADQAIERVSIGHGDAPAGHDDLMINLSRQIPDYFSRFQRVSELVPADPDSRQHSREHFRFYRDRGYPLHTHEL